MSLTHVSAEWEEWIVVNIERGVPATALVDQMVKKDFDLAVAMTAVAQRIAAPTPKNDSRRPSSSTADRNRIEIADHMVGIVTRTTAPEIIVYEHVLTEAECDELVALSRPKLTRSTTVDKATGHFQVIDERSSEGTFFLRGANPLVARIEGRLSAITGTAIDNGEGLQILHYGVGAEYRPHFDFFSPEDSGSIAHLQKGGQRVSTLIMYLNDVDSGGETLFPEIGFAVAPRKGCGVFFSYCDSKGNLDRRTLHGGAPVTRGEKWIATHWLRQEPYC